jgi:hypothetical protein
MIILAKVPYRGGQQMTGGVDGAANVLHALDTDTPQTEVHKSQQRGRGRGRLRFSKCIRLESLSDALGYVC